MLLFSVGSAVVAKGRNPRHFKLESSAFGHMGDIPSRYTCKGLNTSPPLNWDGAPPDTKSFVLIMDDPDAPDPRAPNTTWVHWVVYNIPGFAHGLKEGGLEMPSGTKMARNSWHKASYGGPCPPIGKHRYFFKLYALPEKLKLAKDADKAAVEKAMAGHVLAHTELIGLYESLH